MLTPQTRQNEAELDAALARIYQLLPAAAAKSVCRGQHGGQSSLMR